MRTVSESIHKTDKETEEEILQYTIIKEFEDTIEISNEEEITISTLVSTTRIMPNGDKYLINGNIEQYIPIIPIDRTQFILKELNSIDKDLQRGTEDLIELFIAKGLIEETELPIKTIERLNRKKELRNALKEV